MKKTSWQILFLVGLSISILISYLLFSGLAGNVVSAISLIVLVLNALLMDSSAPQANGAVVKIAAKVLNVSRGLKIATVMTWTYALLVLSIWSVEAINKMSRVDVHVTLLNNMDLLTPGRVVLFTTSDSIAQYSETGKFVFLDVDVGSSDSIKLVARSGSRRIRERFLLQPGRDLIIKFLTSEKPNPLSIQYYTVLPDGISYLFNSESIEKWQHVIGEKGVIVNNAVLKMLKNLHSKFKARSYYEGPVRLRDGSQSLVTEADSSLRSSELYSSIHHSKLQGALTSTRGWSLDFDYDVSERAVTVDYSSIRFVRPLNLQDLVDYGYTAEHDFYNFISTGTLPPGLGSFEIQCEPQLVGAPVDEEISPADMCVDNHQWYELTLGMFLPALRLNIAVIKNSQNYPISVGSIFYMIHEGDSLRNPEADYFQMVKSGIKKEDSWIPPQFNLDPGQSIMIPLSIFFTTSDRKIEPRSDLFYNQFSNVLSNLPLTKQKELVNNKVVLELGYHDDEEEIKQQSYAVLRTIRQNSFLFDSSFQAINKAIRNNIFYFGPSYKLESVELNNERYPIREYNPGVRFITAAPVEYLVEGLGSCPFAFSATESGLTLERVILLNQNSEAKFNYDTIMLKHFTCKMKVKELDPEQSHIDFIKVLEVTAMGERIDHLVDVPELKKSDQDFKVLNQGESIALDFSCSAKLDSKYWLISKGYYVPYKNIRLATMGKRKRMSR
jgi:hypothetical protein